MIVTLGDAGLPAQRRSRGELQVGEGLYEGKEGVISSSGS